MTQILNIGDSFIQFTAKRSIVLWCELPEKEAVFNGNFSLSFSERLALNFKAILM